MSRFLIVVILILCAVIAAPDLGETGYWQNVSVVDSTTQNPAEVSGNALKVQIATSSGNTVEINSSGQMHVVQRGKVCDANSTTTPLGAGAVFTGTAVETLDYAIIVITVFADQASATDGLSVQFSSDGTNWDSTDTYTILANTGKTYSFQTAAQYFRVVYTNGGTIQTAFRLQTIMKKTYSKPSSHRVGEAISAEDDAELVKAAITGSDPDGTFRNVNTTVDGDLSISNNSSGLSIAQGNVTGASFIHKFGSTPDFDTADGAVTIWDGAEDNVLWENMVYDYSSSADIQYLSSTDNGDGQTVEVQGLDSSYDLVTQSKALDGQDSVTLDTPLIRIFRMKNSNSTDFAGHVFASTSVATEAGGGIPTAANIRAVVQPGNNQTEMAVYTIPNGYTGYMRSWYSSTAGANKTSNYIIRLKARPTGGVFQLKHRAAISDTGSSYIQHRYEEPEVFAAKTDIEMTVEMTAGGGTAAAVSGGFDIVLIAD